MSTQTSPRSPSFRQFDSLRNWTKEVEQQKQADNAGTGMGKTTHPSKNVDDGTSKPTEGARAHENTKDVEEMVPANVDGSGTVGKDQNQQQLNIGLKAAPTGEDHSVERDFKDRPKDPGTTMPADASVGEKYSFDLKTSDGQAKCAAALCDLANAILADISVAGTQPKSAEVVAPENKNAATVSPSAAEVPATPASASAIDIPALLGLDKNAADQTARGVIETLMAQASRLGDRVGRELLALKQAEEGAPPHETEDKTDGPAPKADIADMLGGAGGGAAPVPADGGGGAPPMDPAAGGGAPPGAEGALGAVGGGAGAGAVDPKAMQELYMALTEILGPGGIQQLAAMGQGGGPAGPGGPGGDMPPGAAEMGPKIAAALTAFQRSGKAEFRECKTAEERALRNQMKAQLLEVFGWKK